MDVPDFFDLELFLIHNMPALRAGALKASLVYGGDPSEILSRTLETLWGKECEIAEKVSEERRQAFIFATLKNHARNSERAERRFGERLEPGLEDENRDRPAPARQQPEEVQEARARAEAIMEAIAELDGLQQDAMFFMATLRLNRDAACEAMKISRGHLRQLLSKATPKVKEGLERRGIRPEVKPISSDVVSGGLPVGRFEHPRGRGGNG